MIITKRGKRRLLILLGITLLLAAGAAGVVGLRTAQQARRLTESRAEGIAAYEAGDYETALSKLGYVVRRDPTNVEGLLACGRTRALVADPNGRHVLAAASLFRAVLRIEPENLGALEGLLPLYRQVNYRAELTEVADRVLAIDADHIEALSSKAQVAYLDGDYDAVIQITEHLSALEPQEMPWRALQLAALRAGGADDELVLQLCDDWIAEHERDGRFRLVKAQLLVETGRIEEGRESVIEAAGLGTDSEDVLQKMLLTLDAFGLRDEVSALLDRYAGDAWVFDAAVRYHWQGLRLDKALVELERAEENLGALDLRLLGWQALVHADRGELEQAREVADRLRALSGDASPADRESARAWAHAIDAIGHLASNDWAAAIDDNQAAIALRRDDRVLQYLSARAYQRMGENDLAIELLGQLAAGEPGSLGTQLSLAEALLTVGRARDAFGILGQVMRRRPDMPIRAYLVLARAWLRDPLASDLALLDLQSGRRVELVDLLERLHAQLGWQTQTTGMLVEAYQQRGRTRDVLDLVGQALEDPDTPANVLLTLAEASERWELGVEQDLLEEARFRDGLTPAVALAEARLLRRSGRPEEAIAVVEEARRSAARETGANVRFEGGPDAGPDGGLEWTRIRMLLETAQPEAAAEAIAWLERSSRPRESLALLGLDAAWKDQSLVKAIVEQAKAAFGERLPQVRLAEAQYLYRFERDDPASIARALGHVGDVLQSTPRSKFGLVLMADLQLAADPPQRDEAIRTLRAAIDTYGGELPLYPLLINLLQQDTDFETARQYLAQFTERLGEDDRDLRRTAVRLLQTQGDFEDAAGELATMVDDASPESDRLWLASLLSRTGELEQAETIIDGLLRKPRPGNEVIDMAAGLYAATGRLDDGVALLESRLDVPDESTRARRVGQFLLRSGAVEAAEPYLRRAVDLDDATVDSWVALAGLHLAKGDLEQAERAITRGLEIEPGNDALTTLLAVTKAARDTLDQDQVGPMLSGLDATNPAVARIVQLSSRIGEADEQDLAETRRLVREFPSTMAAWRVAIDLHASAERWEDAIDLARQAVGRLPTDPAPAEIATRLLIQQGRTDAAIEMAYLWRRRVLQAPLPADTVIAALLIDDGRQAEAFDRLEPYADRLWHERDGFPDRLDIWLTALITTDRDTEAGRIIERLVPESPNWRDRCLGIASRLDPEPAERLLLALEPHLADEPVDRLRLAIAWHDLARRSGADTALERAGELASSVSDDPELARAATVLHAGIASAREQLADAESLYRKLLRDDADDVITLNNLADVLARQEARCDEAVDLAERAAGLANYEPSVVLTLAQALTCAGRYAEAEDRLRAILEQGLEHPQVFLTRARIRYAQGRMLEAREDLEQARRRATMMDRPDASLRRSMQEMEKRLDGQPAASADTVLPRDSSERRVTNRAVI